MLKDRGQRNKSLEKAFHDSEHGPVVDLPRSTENRMRTLYCMQF